jgi:hypothetical protein
MRRRLLFFGLLALFPGMVSAQESKLVNCRTLEAAGNFVGPDEVIVDDMVCQKVKAGSDAAAKPLPQKPVIGTVISDTPADSVVDAAKAAEKRVAERRELEAAKNAAAPAAVAAPATEPAPAAQNAAPAVAPAKATEALSEPSPEPRAAAATATTGAAPEPAAVAPTPEVPAIEPKVTRTPEPAPAAMPMAPAQATKSEVAAPAEPARQLAAPSAAEAKPESAAPLEIVLSSAPANAPAPQGAEPKTEAPAEPAAAPATAPATASAAEPVPAASASAPRGAPTASAEPGEATSPATSTGFYDVNAPKDGAQATPPPNTGFATAEQVNSGLAPGASAIPAAGETAASESPEPEPLHTTMAAARVDFDEDRDRSVKLGDFAKPRDAAPDPSTEHRTSVDPSEADGFQDRQRPECTKNITLGGLQGEKLVLGVPGWAAKWIEKNEKRMPQICFSETPMKGARNYLIVFATPRGADNGKDIADAAVNPEKGSSAAGVGTFTTSFGSTWHYSYDRNVGTTVLTEDDADVPYSKPGQLLYATAFTEEGVPVTQRWPGQAKQETKPTEKNVKKLKGEIRALEHVSDELLGQLVEDIEKL